MEQLTGRGLRASASAPSSATALPEQGTEHAPKIQPPGNWNLSCSEPPVWLGFGVGEGTSQRTSSGPEVSPGWRMMQQPACLQPASPSPCALGMQPVCMGVHPCICPGRWVQPSSSLCPGEECGDAWCPMPPECVGGEVFCQETSGQGTLTPACWAMINPKEPCAHLGLQSWLVAPPHAPAGNPLPAHQTCPFLCSGHLVASACRRPACSLHVPHPLALSGRSASAFRVPLSLWDFSWSWGYGPSLS